jgi:hypothetical protein
MAIDTMNNLLIHLVAHTTRSMASIEAVTRFLETLEEVAPILSPDRFGFFEPIRERLDKKMLHEQLKPIYATHSEDVIFKCSKGRAGMITYYAAKSYRTWRHGFSGEWNYSKVLPHLESFEKFVGILPELTESAYIGAGIGGGNTEWVSLDDPRKNLGSVGGLAIPPQRISGIECLTGVFWINVFGPEYIEFFGKPILEKLPGYKREFLHDGRWFWLQPTEKPEEMFTADGVALVRQIRELLGQPKAFCDYDTSRPPFMTRFDRPDFDFSAIRPTIPGE